ncbi:hypothetical protein AAE478_002153 [Parahypoxylon ruwenzoriense]
MRLLSLLILCLSALQTALAAPDVTGAPACGLKCILTSTANSDCLATNTTCICANELLQNQITECVTKRIGLFQWLIWAMLATKKFSSETCGVVSEDRTGIVWILAIIFGALGLVAFILRCAARLIGPHDWGYDDSVMCVVMLYYYDEIIYVTALALTKISILFFYLKVFPKRSFRIITWVLIAVNLVYAIIYDFLLILQCDPVSGAWRSWDGEFASKCISINVLGWSAAAINIALDIAVIVLPLPELFRLSLSLRKRLQIIAMFTVGFFITIVSIVRLYSLIRFGTTKNLTQDYVETGYWSTIEVPVGIICACMPAVRSLFSLALPRIFGTTRGTAASTFNSYAGPPSGNRLAHSSNKISIKQEWTVLSDPVDEPPRHLRNGSDVELLDVGGVGKAITKTPDIDKYDVPTRKMTLSKRDGSWRGMSNADRNATYEVGATVGTTSTAYAQTQERTDG